MPLQAQNNKIINYFNYYNIDCWKAIFVVSDKIVRDHRIGDTILYRLPYIFVISIRHLFT